MHRSGTSCLTGSLQANGLVLGKFHEENRYNKKGNRENQDLVDLHDSILESNNGSWDSPPSTANWEEEHVAAAKKILAQYAAHDYWGFKDPRALLCLSGWKKLTPNIQFVGTFRHPSSVAASLGNRSNMSREDALHLWHHYNTKLIEEFRVKPFPLLSFDWPEKRFHAALDDMISAIGLPKLEASEQFFTNQLRTHSNDGYEGLPSHVSELYRNLQTAADKQ